MLIYVRLHHDEGLQICVLCRPVIAFEWTGIFFVPIVGMGGGVVHLIKYYPMKLYPLELQDEHGDGDVSILAKYFHVKAVKSPCSLLSTLKGILI